MTRLTILYTAISLLLVSGCSFNTGRYQQRHDSTPTRLPTAAELQDPIPRFEQKSAGGNRKIYEVRGKYYQVLDSAEGFKQTGTASWYGNKFHGHLTSNGEIYDMYAMSAAHKNLPLPTYVKVTNLANNQAVIVRVNDRGPFHDNRIIDLSYSAAYKIGMLKTGTAKVSIEAITNFDQQLATSSEPSIVINNTAKPANLPSKNATVQTSDANTEQLASFYIQVFATKSAQTAESTAQALASLYQQNVIYPEQDGLYRVQIGPFPNGYDPTELINSLKGAGYANAYRRNLLQ